MNGVPIETGQTNVSIVDPSMYTRGSAVATIGAIQRQLHGPLLAERPADDNASATGLRRCSGYQDLIDTNLALSNAHMFSSNKLNEFRFSLVRRNLDFPENDPVSPSATITGLFGIGGASNFPQGRITNAISSRTP